MTEHDLKGLTPFGVELRTIIEDELGMSVDAAGLILIEAGYPFGRRGDFLRNAMKKPRRGASKRIPYELIAWLEDELGLSQEQSDRLMFAWRETGRQIKRTRDKLSDNGSNG